MLTELYLLTGGLSLCLEQ